VLHRNDPEQLIGLRLDPQANRVPIALGILDRGVAEVRHVQFGDGAVDERALERALVEPVDIRWWSEEILVEAAVLVVGSHELGQYRHQVQRDQDPDGHDRNLVFPEPLDDEPPLGRVLHPLSRGKAFLARSPMLFQQLPGSRLRVSAG
jgi:hypothetical protein